MQHFGEADYEIEKAIAEHHGTPYTAKNCKCWKGYKRVPGTEPCAPGSCEKCDSHSKKSAIKFANNEWEKAKDIIVQRYPEQADPMGGGSQAIEVAKHHLDQIFEEATRIAGEFGGPTVENFVAAIEQIYNLGGKISKIASQGDKPSPKAAQAVLAALEAGNESEAKELLKMTDCPEGCETHPEGKCNHQYMSAGRTRVRYLINDSSFDKDPNEKDFGTTDHELNKEAGVGQDIINMIMSTYSQYPNFARTVASILMQAGKAFNQGIKGQQWGALGPHIENCFNLWREGKLGLDDIDQILIGNNVVGDVNVDLPARADDFQTQQTTQPAQTAPTQQMSLAAKYRQ